MKAPHPALARLFRLAAAPTQRAQAWRAQGDMLAALNREVDDSAAASDARIEALLGEPQVGSVLAAPLARLAAGQVAESEAVVVPGRQRPPAAPRNGSPAIERAAAPVLQPAAAARQSTGAAVQRRPAPPAAPAGPATPWPVGARLPASTRQLPRAASPAATVSPAGWPAAVQRAGGAATGGRTIDAPGAAARLEARATHAGAAGAWQRAVDLRPMPGSSAPFAAAFDPVPSDAGGAARGSDAPVQVSDAALAPQRVERALARLAADPTPPTAVTQGPRAPTPAPANAAARTAVVAALTPPRPPLEALGSPLRATRIGGFKGLAALGRVAGPASGPAAGTPSVALQGAARPQPATLDPQAVIDHVESALREQAGRSGVSIEGLEP